MHVCTYVCIYIYIYIHTYIHMYIYIYIYMQCMYVCMYVCMYDIYIYIYIYYMYISGPSSITSRVDKQLIRLDVWMTHINTEFVSSEFVNRQATYWT